MSYYSGYSGAENGDIGSATSWRPGQNELTAPAAPSGLTTASTGGTVLAGTYGVELTYLNGQGETVASAATQIVVPAGTSTNTITIPSPAATTVAGAQQATGWYAYVTQAGGSSYTRQQAAGSPTAIGTAFTLTAPPTSTGAAPPTSNTSGFDPAAVVAPTQFTMGESDGLGATFDQLERNVFGGGRDSDRGHRTGKAKAGGNVTLGFYADNGIEYLINGLGTEAYTPAPAADTTTAITTSGGVSILTLASGAAPYGVPSIVTVDTGATQECLPVIGWNSGTKQLTLPALQNTHAASGTTVQLLGYHLSNPYTEASGYANLLRRMSIEDNVGNIYSYAYPNTMVGKWALKATGKKSEVTVDLVCSGKRQLLASPTAFNESDPSLNNLSFEFTDGFVVMPVDPAGSGTSTLQRSGDVEDWDLTIDNKMRELPCLDGSAYYRYFPGQRQIDITFTMLSSTNRPVGFEDFVKQQKNAQWFAFACQNVGTPADPSWQAVCFYVPNLRYLQSKDKKGINDIVGETITARALHVGTEEKLYVAIVNSTTAAY